MKKTFTINISGIVFHIDEDAFENLQEYLDAIDSRFANEDEGKEIIADVEARVAELFQESITEAKQVITVDDVNQMIGIMGNPEDYGDDENATQNETKEKKTGKKFGKRVYRDPENRILGGVGSGLAAYFGLDPMIMRLLLVCTFFFSGPLLYIILWIVIPEAKTRAQKLEMKGESINIGNIEKSIKEEFHTVKDNFKDFKKKKAWQRSESVVERLAMVFLTILNIFGRVFLICIGIFFIVIGIVLIFSFLVAMFAEHSVVNIDGVDVDSVSLNSILNLFVDPANLTFLWVGLLVVVGIPVAGIIWGGIKILFRIKTGSRITGAVAFIIWICGLVLLTIVGLREGKHFRNSAKSENIYYLNDTISDIYHIQLAEGKHNFEGETISIDMGDIEFVSSEDEACLYGKPELDIVRSESGKFELELKKRSRGNGRKDALHNAERIDYKWNQNDSLIVFDPYYTLGENAKFRVQDLEMVLSNCNKINVSTININWLY